MPIVDAALGWAARGIPVFPLHRIQEDGTCSCGRDCGKSAGKHPLSKGWQGQATRDADAIRRLWRTAANIGGATGAPAGAWVLDVDGAPGQASLDDLTGLNGQLPETLTIRTGSGGLHLWFRMPEDGRAIGNRAKIREKLDARGTGGLVVLPPSSNQNGVYTVERDVPIADAPGWLLDLVAPPKVARPLARSRPLADERDAARRRLLGMASAAAVRIAGTPEGSRNHTVNAECYRLGGYAAWLGMSLDELRPDLEAAAVAADQSPTMVLRSLTAGADHPIELPADSQEWQDRETRWRTAFDGPPLDVPEPPDALYDDEGAVTADEERQERGRLAEMGLDLLRGALGGTLSGGAAADNAITDFVRETLINTEQLDMLAEARLTMEAAYQELVDRIRGNLRRKTEIARLVDAVNRRARELARLRGGDAGTGAWPRFEQNDAFNARWFQHLHGSKVLWYTHTDDWLVWTGQKWGDNQENMALTWMIESMVQMQKEAARLVRLAGGATPRPDLGELGELMAEWATKSKDAKRINAALSLARSGHSVRPGHMNADKMLFNAANCVLNLETREVHQHHPRYKLTKISPVPYDPAAQCPRWLAFLRDCFPDDGGAIDQGQLTIDMLQRWLGYCLTGLVSEQRIVFFVGDGANGKSTLLEAVRYVMGEYTRPLPAGFLEPDGDQRHPAELAMLDGVRLGVLSELKGGGAVDEPRIKALTGSEGFTARGMGENFRDIEPTTKFVVGTNHRPRIRNSDWGIWRRMLIVEFGTVIPEHLQDPRLLDKLRAEGSGILNWLLEGLARFREVGLDVPEHVKAARDAYRSSQDLAKRWLDERTQPDAANRVTNEAGYADFVGWWQGESPGTRPPYTRHLWAREVQRLGIRGWRTARARGIEGIRLINGG